MKLVLAIYFSLSATLVFAQMKKIIFVCEHGAAKSVIAAAYFNKIAKEKNLNWEAISRGTFPDSTLTESTRQGLKGDRIYDPKRVPQKLSLNDTVNAEHIILFTPLPGGFSTRVPVEDWSSIPNIDAEYISRRNAIVNELNALLDKLEKLNKDEKK
jgi:arsenate reductase (thioredoxin)